MILKLALSERDDALAALFDEAADRPAVGVGERISEKVQRVRAYTATAANKSVLIRGQRNSAGRDPKHGHTEAFCDPRDPLVCGYHAIGRERDASAGGVSLRNSYRLNPLILCDLKQLGQSRVETAKEKVAERQGAKADVAGIDR